MLSVSLFTVEGQKLTARTEMKDKRIATKAAVIIEYVQESSGRLYYDYCFMPLDQCPKAGDPLCCMVPGWSTTVRATVFPWEV